MQLLDHISEKTKTAATVSKAKKRKAIDLHEQTLASLLNIVDSSFSIDWNQISTLDVELRHSSYSCEAMWLVYLHPQLKRDDWTNEEDENCWTQLGSISCKTGKLLQLLCINVLTTNALSACRQRYDLTLSQQTTLNGVNRRMRDCERLSHKTP